MKPCKKCITRKASLANDLCLFCVIKEPEPLPSCPNCKVHPRINPEGLCFRCDEDVTDLSQCDEEKAIIKAKEILARGGRVHLPSSKSAGTLVMELMHMNKPGVVYDLGLVTVPGTNIFCPDHKFIDRGAMPQISGKLQPGAHRSLSKKQQKRLEAEKGKNGEHRLHADGSPIYFMNFSEEFVSYLQELGFSAEEGYVLPGWLKSTQRDLDGSTVARLAKALQEGRPIEGLGNPVFVSREGYIIDGHHRWAALLAADAADGEIDGLVHGSLSPLLATIIDIEISEALDLAEKFSKAMKIMPDAFFESQ